MKLTRDELHLVLYALAETYKLGDDDFDQAAVLRARLSHMFEAAANPADVPRWVRARRNYLANAAHHDRLCGRATVSELVNHRARQGFWEKCVRDTVRQLKRAGYGPTGRKLP